MSVSGEAILPSQTILVHGSTLGNKYRDGNRPPLDIDVVSLNPLTEQDKEAIRSWLESRGLDPNLPIDSALSIAREKGYLTVPSPQGIIPSYELIGDKEVPVQIVAIEGLSAALRAATMNRQEAARHLMSSMRAISLSTETSHAASLEGWDKYAIGLTGMRNAYSKDPKQAVDLLSEHPFGKVLVELIKHNPAISIWGGRKYADAEEITFCEDIELDMIYALFREERYDDPDKLLEKLFTPDRDRNVVGSNTEVLFDRKVPESKIGKFLSRLFK